MISGRRVSTRTADLSTCSGGAWFGRAADSSTTGGGHVIVLANSGRAKTMPEDRGLSLDTTWRLSPAICAFTSEVFYEGRLRPQPENEA